MAMTSKEENMTTASVSETAPVLPTWFTEGVTSRFRAGISSVFILNGDIACLVPNPYADKEKWQYIPLDQLFARIFDEREMVIFYNIASGPRFLTLEMEKNFRKVTELDKEDDGDGKDPVAAAKAKLAAKRPIPREPELCLPLIEKALKNLNSVAVIIESAHFLAPEASGGTLPANERIHIERIRSWAQDARVKKRTNLVLLLTDLASKISGELRQTSSRISTVFIPKPSPEERRRYAEHLTKGTKEEQEVVRQIKALESKLKRAKGEAGKEIEAEVVSLNERLGAFPMHFEVPEDFDLEEFVNATQGMSLRQILEIFRQSRQDGKYVDLLFVRNKKREILNSEYGDVMEVIDPDWGLDDIGGLDHIKDYFREIIEAIRRGEIRAIPQGATLMGPPGTGKTALVEALAKESRYNFVQLKNARSMWVGQSEARTERQIQGLLALAPVVVMNDEADLGGANRDAPKGDSGVSERIEQSWMKFLSDPRIQGKVIWLNCTNRPDRIDAAMKRSGRSDDRLALLMPPENERKAIFEVMFNKYKIATSVTDFGSYAKETDGFSGADIRKIVLESFKFAARKRKKAVDDECLQEAIADFIPSASQSDIDLMTLLAISEASSRRLLPSNTKEILKQIKKRNLVPGGAELIAQIEARRIVKLD